MKLIGIEFVEVEFVGSEESRQRSKYKFLMKTLRFMIVVIL